MHFIVLTLYLPVVCNLVPYLFTNDAAAPQHPNVFSGVKQLALINIVVSFICFNNCNVTQLDSLSAFICNELK